VWENSLHSKENAFPKSEKKAEGNKKEERIEI